VVDQEDLDRCGAKNSQAYYWNREDAMNLSRWRKLIKDDDQDRCEWVNVSSGTSSPGCPRQSAVKQLLLFPNYYYNHFTALWILSGTTRVSQ